MDALYHPSELSNLGAYRQARNVLRYTSRAQNADWYRAAHELDRQWHLWFDGVDVVSAVFCQSTGVWHPGPAPVLPMPASSAAEAPQYSKDGLRSLHETLYHLIKNKELGGKARSLGVVIHVADEFGLAELGSECAADDDFDAVRRLLVLDPHESLGDQRIDPNVHSWRLLPYWGVTDGERRSVAVQLSRRYEELVSQLKLYGEQRNLPVVVEGVSAPLEAIRLAPLFVEGEGTGDGQVLVFIYRQFTVLSLFDEKAELNMVRCLPHRPGEAYPSRLGEALVNSAAAVNLNKPQVTIVPMSKFDVEPLTKKLASFFSRRSTSMNIGLVHLAEVPGIADLPVNRAELGICDPTVLGHLRDREPFASSVTFQQLEAGWATQDFYGDAELEAAIYPTRSDLKLLRFFGIGKWLLAFGVIGLMGWTSFDFISTVTKEYWRLAAPDAQSAEANLTELEAEKKRVEHWENKMAKRSEGWLAMEVLLALFPSDAGLVVSECSYEAAGEQPTHNAQQMAFSRQWKIKGFARDDGLEVLSKLGSRSHLEEKFTGVAEEYGVDSLRSDSETRELKVTMQQKKGQMPAQGRYPRSVARYFRNAFELKVTQSFSDRDSLALNLRPPEKS